MKNIRIVHINCRKLWDDYVMKHDKSVYTHLFDFGAVIRGTYGHQRLHLAAARTKKDGRQTLAGILPLVVFKKICGKSRFVSIPYFDTAGILADNQEIATRLFDAAVRCMPLEKTRSMELRQPGTLDLSGMAVNNKAPRIYDAKVGLTLLLESSQQDMMAGFKSKLRSQIQKGLKQGLTWKIGRQELIDPFYRIFSRNMRDLGSPVHAKRLFKQIFTRFPFHAFICVVYYSQKPVAASFMFKFKDRLANPWASSIREYRHLNVNMVLYWQMLRLAINMGLKIFDMGRSTRGAATYRFKKQWGPSEDPIFWYEWPCPGHRLGKRRESLSLDHWHRLPMGAANLLGPKIRKHISL